ncbi:hypothetical protein NA57DRAFT_32887 [Rhizodiscina lignyota]|uniref:Zn(2)-C6 fungal-type domain-containing protein n=1 Tax=Rhizodiscina lignyota TaxID=1504668 RepID=A0A9P4IP96_9PEZI|nr:hypothetical protein NA57DRAFT_32887 [Rhizodiscina lignyota]
MDPASRRVPLDKRKRTETSCDKCKIRKQKCDRQLGREQCRYCELHGITCTTTAPRKKRVYGTVEGLGSRITLLESLVKGLLPDADISSNDEMQQLGKSLGIALPVIEDVGANEVESAQPSPPNKQDDPDTIPLVPDQQGQVQWIGPSSSFLFHLNLRKMIGNYSTLEFAMFGRNAADQIFAKNYPKSGEGYVPYSQRAISNIQDHCDSPSEAVKEIDPVLMESLLDSYFDIVHPDFPILHEASFREAYEIWSASSTPADPVWLCGLLCVLILAQRVAPIPIELSEDYEKKWFRHVHLLLPTVVFSSTVYTVQALMLAALHLHNTNHRDACWNLTGTAVRVAYAIGLHRDDLKHVQSPLGRELRKQLWWTLYAFEQMQVSSYDRPSAIAQSISSVSCPNERIVGVTGHCPPEFTKWSQKLVRILGSACRALAPIASGSASEDSYSKPLSPAATILRDLDKWKEGLPHHLQLEVTSSLAPAAQRPLLLLHMQFYYILIVISRTALLRRATIVTKGGRDPTSQSFVSFSETCIDAGRSLAKLLQKLDVVGKFNAVTWFDCFLAVTAAMVLVLDIRIKLIALEHARNSQQLLADLAALAERQLQNPKMPETMQKMATIVGEINLTANDLISSSESHNSDRSHTQYGLGAVPLTPGDQQDQPTVSFAGNTYVVPMQLPQQPTPSDALSSEDALAARDQDPQFWNHLSFMDEGDGQFQDWSWDDIGSILRSR